MVSVANSLLFNDCVLRQDYTAVHRSQHILDFLVVHDLDLIHKTSKYSDSNITENVWGRLARDIYKNGFLIGNVVHLQDTIVYAWNDIDLEYIRALYVSIPSLLIRLFQNIGGMTSY